jgi:hypothetical protein
MKKIFLLIIFCSFSYGYGWYSHSCTKPYKPYKFNSKNEIMNFKYDVERYESCIKNFIEEQKREIQNRKNAINDAINEYNNFIMTL